MNKDMENGLSKDKWSAADLKMYITYVRSVPDGSGKFVLRSSTELHLSYNTA